ncbi:MAG: hypothetical protein KG029_13560, partial [Bacteroidetes bacterium]|nr:hypothetical protein [Bacteroidota bacterium]
MIKKPFGNTGKEKSQRIKEKESSPVSANTNNSSGKSNNSETKYFTAVLQGAFLHHQFKICHESLPAFSLFPAHKSH